MSDETTSHNETPASPGTGTPVHYQRPDYEVRHEEDTFHLSVSMPGVTKDGVNVTLNDHHLRVTGTRTSSVDPGLRPVIRELDWSDYQLNLELAVDIQPEGINARVEDGILRLELLQAESAKRRVIEIS